MSTASSFRHTLMRNDLVTTPGGRMVWIITAVIPGINIVEMRLVNAGETTYRVSGKGLEYLGHLPG